MLVDAGWTVLRIWEHEDLDTALSMVDDALTKTR
jgi:very-short-patch-repair endonuclease